MPDNFEQICHDHRLKCTAQRGAVFMFLSGNRTHPTADEIWRSARRMLPGISLDSIYRILEDFCRVGLVQKLECGAGAVRYDPNVLSHDHFYCRTCGRLIDVADDIERPGLDAFADCGKVEQLEFRIKGICKSCLNGSERETFGNNRKGRIQNG